MKRLAGALALFGLACVAAAAARTLQRDGAIVMNSGSTNVPGYTIKIWSDGSAWAVRTRRGGAAISEPVTGTVSKELAAAFFAGLRTAKAKNVTARGCEKSASFGATLVVQYHGWTTPDLRCPGDGQTAALASQASEIAAALKVGTGPGRVTPMLPNERRRPPIENPPSQASATPEPASPAS